MRQLFDRAKIWVEGGRGGDGCISFRREKYVPRGGPDGGDGGDGGSVILEVDPELNTLLYFSRHIHFKAERGEHGKGKNQRGRNGDDLIVKVPPGTEVYDADTGELICDLVKPGQRIVVAKGGKGGRGNAAFASPEDRAPRRREKGKEGEKRWIRLELKLIADVGLVGFPNAGKSTLLSRISNAHPKIASYPFTTLNPHLGTVERDSMRLTFADLPGIIEDAHKGKGLGLEFLRHIERTRMLLFVLDVTKDPASDYNILLKELREYNPELLKRKRIVAINKIDIKEPPPISFDVPSIPISAKEKINLDLMLDEIFSTLKKEVVNGEEKEEGED